MKKTAITIIILLFFSCKNELELAELYRQPIPNSSKVIYYFRYFGAFVSSSEYTGYSILDSSETFKYENINELRDGFIDYIDSNNAIHMLNLPYDENYKYENDSMGFYFEKYSDIEVITSEYNSGWGNNNRYFFKRVTDNTDSITFYGLKIEYGKKLPDTVSFKKGGIFISDKKGIIEHINFSKLITRKKGNNLIEYGTETFEFYPTDIIMISTLSDYGFFKRIK